MNKIPPERQLDILDHLDEMSKKLNTFHQCTVYDDFLEDLKYVKELIRRDLGQPMEQLYLSKYIRGCPKCGTVLDSIYPFEEKKTINYCEVCGQALYECEEISNG